MKTLNIFENTKRSLSLVKISHALFSLPFVLSALLMSSRGTPSLEITLKIILAVVLARNAAMAFNRLVDARFDAANPRTAGREIPAGLLSKKFVCIFITLNSAGFIFISLWINKLCFQLSPIALAVLFSYSICKRYISATQFVLGFALGISVPATWIAATGSLNIIPITLGAAVLFWVAGFDLIYSTLDYEFDKANGLKNLVVKLGVHKALLLARLLHFIAISLLFLVGIFNLGGLIYFSGIFIQACLLLYEHSLVSEKDLSKVNTAFFTVNGCISLLYLLTTYLDYSFQ